jgi:predicted CXXCH cytochrome family protein
MRRPAVSAAVALILGCLLTTSTLEAQERFPHENHSVFFAECEACHTDLASGATEGLYPEASMCTACHDGTTAPEIQWERPEEPRASNLEFAHAPHPFECAMCHLPGGSEDLSDIGSPAPALCVGCHAPEAESHLQAEECSLCHVAVVESPLTQEVISGFPTPPSHEAPSFAVTHGISAADSPANCSVCHDRTSCFTCHQGATHLPSAILDIPLPAETGPAGVQLFLRDGPSFHEGNFATAHGAAASAGQPDCTTCHSETSCVACHEAQSSPSFHPLNFLASHGPEAYGRVSDCSSCHNTEAFCRECHLGMGIQGSGGAVAPYHDNQGLWILSHPQAARQDLESCVSCHQQQDCLRCHSAGGGFRVSPHGPDFEGSSLADRNQGMCRLCHGT